MPLFNPFRPTINQDSISNVTVNNSYSVVSVTTLDGLRGATEFPKLVLFYDPSLTDQPTLYTWVDSPNFEIDPDTHIQSLAAPSRYWIPLSTIKEESAPVSEFVHDPFLNPANFELTAPQWTLPNATGVSDSFIADNIIPQSAIWKSNRGLMSEVQISPTIFLNSLDVGVEAYTSKKALRIPAGYQGVLEFPRVTSNKLGILIVYKGKNISFSALNNGQNLKFSIKGIEEAIPVGGSIIRVAGDNWFYSTTEALDDYASKVSCASFYIDNDAPNYSAHHNRNLFSGSTPTPSPHSFSELVVNNSLNDEDAYIFEITIFNNFAIVPISTNAHIQALLHYDPGLR